MENTKKTQDIHTYSLRKVFAFGMTSMLLCMSILLSVLTPFPLAVSSLLYGRMRTALMFVAVSVLFYVVVVQFFTDGTLFLAFIASGVLAAGISEMIYRDVKPITGILAVGSLVLMLVGAAYGVYSLQSDKTLKQAITAELESIKPLLDEQKKKLQMSSSSDTLEMEAMLDKPELLAEEFLRNAPSFFAVMTFMLLWINMFFVLRMNRVLKVRESYTYSDKDLLNFKVPDFGIWIVIIGMGLYLGGDYVGLFYQDVGMTLLKVTGVFYFFHGFGIFMSVLDKLKLFGFFRSVIVITTIFTVSWGVAVVGVADTFVDFRKLLNKKNQGE